MNMAPLIKNLPILLLLCHWAAQAAPATPARPAVASVSLSVGDVRRVSAVGTAAPLAAGALIAEGDRIITGHNAVAILVFTDEGRISLRANSELIVKHYRLDPTGADTRLEFELLHGAVRQISGQAARKQPERYRLNTPIATIGVRGTDFLAKTSDTALETYIQEGKIVVLPSLTSCSGQAQAGTCAPFASMSAADEARYLKVTLGGSLERRILGGADVERLFGLSQIKTPTTSTSTPATTATATATATTAASTPPAQPTKMADTMRQPDSAPASALVSPVSTGISTATPEAWAGNMREVSATENNTKITFIAFNKTTEPQATPVVVPVIVPPVLVPPVVVPPVAVPPVVTLTPDNTRQLIWGKFSYAEQLPLQLLAPYATAADGRSVTVGEISQHALWRTLGGPTTSPALKGEVQFDLRSGEAYLEQGTQRLPATITKPTLAINFDQATFTSSLTLTQAQTGSVPLQVAGKLNDEGIFVGTAPGQRVAGAISYDGKEAGFLFNRDNALGVFKGITLWNTR